ncbi:MAG TPA: hypothetical protein VKA64_11385 [Gammaproteobacteria bacterium]|nr:hypothetical protein [Gammaproteobacteria bacterium]
MQRLVLIPVLVSLLLNGLLWAAGGHLEPFGAGAPESAAVQIADHGILDADHEEAGGHRCHSAAHLLGLPARLMAATHSRPAVDLPPYRGRTALRSEPPLLQPPIA